MARRRSGPHVPRRVRFFAACEGQSERALIAWLESRCEDHGLHIHIDGVTLGKCGDPLSLVQQALSERRRRADQLTPDRGAFALVDTDRLEDGTPRSASAIDLAAARGLILIRQAPTFEGMLARMLGQPCSRTVRPTIAERQLARGWPDYRKPPSRYHLERQLTLDGVRTEASSEPGLAALLTALGLA